MSLRIYNSLSNKIEDFVPKENKKVNMYVCGPTVYNSIHIGNARPVVFFDMVKRYLEYSGYDVVYASNITDIDDKIINKSLELGLNEHDFAMKNADNFLKNVSELGCLKPDLLPYATQYIDKMIDFIDELIKNDLAYESDGDVFFRVTKNDNYGKLSNQNVEALNSGSRVDVNNKKESPLDFSLWKKTDVGIKWNSPFGEGRPGWHTECVCMIHSLFTDGIDIHGGGFDLKFPHHENEIAQYEAMYHSELSKYFMHVGRLDMDGEKMSKSLGNMVLVDDLRKSNDFMPIRLLIMMQNYRNKINYSDKLFDDFKKDYEKIARAISQGSLELDVNDVVINDLNNEDMLEFTKHMDDDFNTPNVYTLILKIVKNINIYIRSKNYNELALNLNTLLKIFKVLGFEFDYTPMVDEDKDCYKKWIEARINKNFELADELRKKLVDKGIF